MLPLDPTKIAFNWANTRALADASFRAYAGPNGFANPSTAIWVQDSHTDAHALIEDRGDCIVIAFRGSKDPEDFIQDAKFEFIELVWTNGEDAVKVHRGFLEDFEALNEELVIAIKNIFAGKGSRPVFITGHSLGGALAILCAIELARQHFNVSGIYTFGSPRVGNAGFVQIYELCEWLGSITYRVVNENDLVPRMPPWINGYRHVGQNIFLPIEGGWQKNPALLKIAVSDAVGLWGAFRDLHDVLISDHFIAAYQERIQLL